MKVLTKKQGLGLLWLSKLWSLAESVLCWVELWFLPSGMESIRMEAYGSILSSNYSKEAQDGWGEQSIEFGIAGFQNWSQGTSLQRTLTTTVVLSSYSSSRAADCAFQTIMPKLGGEGGKDSFILLYWRKAFRPRVEAILVAAVVFCWFLRNNCIPMLVLSESYLYLYPSASPHMNGPQPI